jgi:eukaryotic-like serine/threonine-protein kinase
MSGIPAGAGSLLGRRLGKYEILALLALGGTAEIYLARIGGTAGFEKYVVVKCLHDHLADDTEFVKMFLDEARLAALLDHSNIVQTMELGEYENRYYMAMEFLAGLSLAMVVRRVAERLPGGHMPVPLIFNLAAQTCAGLHYAHERTANGKPLNMVHRDISPQNLVISFEGLVKVVDFGIARADQRDTKTNAGTIKGKFAYMSPEQCVATNVDRRTDVFALGVIVHELLTGRRLFKRNSPYETYQAVLECAVPPPSALNHELDPTVDQIVLKACAKDREARYATAEAFGDALIGYLHHRGKGSGPGEMARFLEEHFAQEIEEHGERMRELISSRDYSVETGASWDEGEEKVNETVDLGGSDMQEIRASEASIESLVSRLHTNADAGDADDPPSDDEAPAERTRIEANPLDKVRELHESASGPMHQPLPVPIGSVSGAQPLPAPPTIGSRKPIGGVQSGKFPDLANLPTQIADPTPPPSTLSPPRSVTIPPELASTHIAGELVALASPQSETHIETPTLDRQMAGQSGPMPPIVASPGPAGRPSVPPAGPSSATQSAVRISHMQDAGSGPIVDPGSGLDPAMSPYPVVSGRPTSGDLAPSNRPSAANRASFRSDSYANAQQAANVMSPVGDHYAADVDWAAAAARSAKPIPPWLLAMFFVGALFIALMVTIIVAKIIR